MPIPTRRAAAFLTGLLVAGCAPSADVAPATKPSTKPTTGATGPVLPDTLSGLGDLPSFYDVDTSDLLRRYAEKLVNGSRDGVHFAIQQLGRAGERAVPEILRVLEPRLLEEQQFGVLINGCEALRMTRTRSPAATDAMLKALGHKSGSVVSDAAKTLGAIGDPKSLTALRAAFDGAGVEQRKVIVKAIGELRGAEADEALYKIVVDENAAQGYRWTAAQALAIRDPATAAPYLRKLLDAPTPVGETAAIALAAARDPEGLARTRKIATAPAPPMPLEVVSLASEALVKAGDPEPALAALRSSTAEVRLAAGLVALRGLTDPAAATQSRPAPDPRIEPALRRAEADEAPLVRLEAMRLLVKLGFAPSTGAELEALRSGDPVRVSRALEILTDPQVADRRATPLLLEKLRQAPMDRKRGFAQALGRLRDPSAATALAEYLTSPGVFQDGSWLQDFMARQIANLGKAGLDELWKAYAGVRDPAGRRFLAEGIASSTEPESREHLRAIAENTAEDPEVRAVAIRALPICDGDAAAPFLKRLLETEADARVRRLLNSVLFEFY